MILELEKNSQYIKELNSLFKDILKDVQKDFDSNPFTHYLVYLDQEEVVGYLNYYLIYNRIEIANFNVLEKYQNKGIGTKLLASLIKKYPDVLNITLEVRSDNIKAINIYKKAGFKEKAIRKNYYGNIDGILMERCVM